ncbi:RrF2 family transcriptional regulator [Ruminobacter sp.]|uniref:RrF2 family transcriptional regulator n=1 Tax=Ruminobacter sp. TaxID=2774296 RepID=UPI00386D59D6
MKISTKGRYALRLMIELAKFDQATPVRLKELAERQNISEKYAEQIIGLMRRGGVVNAKRGTQGGYELAKNPKDISVGTILRLTEGDLSPVPCLENNGVPCERKYSCATYHLWEKLNQSINDVVDNTSIAELAEIDRLNLNDMMMGAGI